jgi:Na+/H+ antiporter NhaA
MNALEVRAHTAQAYRTHNGRRIMQKEHKRGFTAAAVMVAAAIALMCSGCATSRPYTKGEKWALGGAFIGQGADVLSTAVAISSYDNIEEGNQVWGDLEDGELIATMFLTKAAFIGCAYLVGEVKPNWRKPMFNCIGAVGGTFAAANVYTMSEYGEHYDD